MNNPKNISIGALCISAAILLAAIMLTNASSATASTSESRVGDYCAVTGATNGSTDILYVIDTFNQRMTGYVPNRNTGTLDQIPGAAVDLKAAFEGGVAPGR